MIVYSAHSGGDDLGLDRLILRVRDETGIQQPLCLLQSAHRIVPGPRGALETGARSHLNSARARAQLLELAHAALLTPGLVLRLADAIHRLRLSLAQSGELHTLRALRAEGGEIACAAGADAEIGPEHADAQRDLLEVLPAHAHEREAPEERPGDDDEPAGGRRDEHAPVREREYAALDGPRLDRLAGDQHRAQVTERLLQALLVGRRGKAHVALSGYFLLTISARSSRNFALTMRSLAGPMRIRSFCPAERASSEGSANV